MKMTREQVADLLLRMNDDFSNVEVKNMLGVWERTEVDNLKSFFNELSKDSLFRIKDNSVKRITISNDLRKEWVKPKYYDYDTISPFDAISVKNKTVMIKGAVYTEDELNNHWQLVED